MGDIAVSQAAVRLRRPVQKCLACGYDNSAEDNACAACGSSLALQLCAACEAINSSRAVHCHACGIELASAGQPTSRPGSRLTETAGSRKNALLAALIGLPLCATLVLAYFNYERGPKEATEPTPLSPLRGKAISGRTDSTDMATPTGVPTKDNAANSDEARPPLAVRDTKTAAPASAAEREDASTSGPEQLPPIGSTAMERQDTTARGAVAAKVSDSKARGTPATGSRTRVTHTKPFVAHVTPAPAAAPDASVALQPVSRGDSEAASACGEAAMALGLCNTQERRVAQ